MKTAAKKRSSRERLLAAGTVAAAVALVAGCGSSSKSSSTTTSGTTATTAAGSSTSGTSGASTGSLPNLHGKSFTMLGPWTGGEQAAFQNVINDFDRQTGASGRYTSASDVSTVLGTDVQGGTPPDIALLSLPGAIAQYAKAGKLQKQPAATVSAVNSNYASTWATLGSYNGTLYGVPVDASDKSTIWYNTKLFNNAGIKSTPTTWQQLISDANTIAASGVSVPVSIGGGDGWTLTDLFENIYLRTAGIADYNKLTQHQIPWTDPTVTTALTTMKQLLTPQIIGSPAGALKVSFTSSVDNVFKASPSSAMVIEASFVATTITGDKDAAVVGQTAKFFPFPSVNGSGSVLEAAGDFSVNFTTNPAALAFSQFLASPAAAKDLVSAPGSGFLSPNKNLANSAYPDATTAGLAQQLINAGNNFVFDMSDQEPASFGGTANQGEWATLQSFLGNGNVAAAQSKLESEAKAAFATGS